MSSLWDNSHTRPRGLFLSMVVVTLMLGIFECVFGRVSYSADAISYLNIVRAIHADNWRLALSSYWGLGYPLLVSWITPLFPATPAGEWVAVHVLNLVVFLATFLTFVWLASAAASLPYMRSIFAEEKTARFVLAGAFAIFLSTELCLDNVSRVGPDMLVSCILFAAAELLLELRQKPGPTRAILLGVILGLGYVVKSIFLPLTLLFCVAAALAMWKKRGALKSLALIVLFSALFVAPYVAAMSWAQGHLTMGDSGPLNYAWNVNRVEPLGLWQGWQPGLGAPIHPAKMIADMPHVYLFNGPFPVTFAPFFNPPYYYEGIRRIFSPRLQAHAFAANFLRVLKMLSTQLILYALVICWLLGRLGRTNIRANTREERPWWKTGAGLWPMLLISGGGIFIYLLVAIDPRYISSFVAILFLALLLAVAAGYSAAQRRGYRVPGAAVLASILAVGCVLTLFVNAKDPVRDVVGNALHHRLFYNGDQWKAGLYLQQKGLKPGDKVAVMEDVVSATLSSWAYMDQLQIVGILGGSLTKAQTADYDAFWKLPPGQQRQTLETFRNAGARAIVSVSKPIGPGSLGWEPIPETNFWLYQLKPPQPMNNPPSGLPSS